LRAFIVIGAVVAVFWVATFYILSNRMAHTGESAICRNEQILLAVSKNQHTISEIRQDRNDLVITTDWRRWMGLNLQRRRDIGMAAACVVAHEGKGGIVLIKSGDTEVGRVVAGKWSSKFGE
jgi:hypothetical protein